MTNSVTSSTTGSSVLATHHKKRSKKAAVEKAHDVAAPTLEAQASTSSPLIRRRKVRRLKAEAAEATTTKSQIAPSTFCGDVAQILLLLERLQITIDSRTPNHYCIHCHQYSSHIRSSGYMVGTVNHPTKPHQIRYPLQNHP